MTRIMSGKGWQKLQPPAHLPQSDVLLQKSIKTAVKYSKDMNNWLHPVYPTLLKEQQVRFVEGKTKL